MFNRWVEDGLLEALTQEGIGSIVFSPLAQGLLTDRYLQGMPADSRAVRSGKFLKKTDITTEKINKVHQLNDLARQRGQSMAQLALAWVLRQPAVTSALIGASKVQQIEDAVGTLNHLDFSAEELELIETILKS
jgi:L-glyceraldehyde 3-phosphate reductase